MRLLPLAFWLGLMSTGCAGTTTPGGARDAEPADATPDGATPPPAEAGTPDAGTTDASRPPCGFSDVPPDHLFCTEIAWMAAEGITDGYDDGSFRPTENLTRMAAAAFLSRLAEADLRACSDAPFTDVPTDHPFCSEITWMANAGIANGYEDGTFRPAADVTRMAAAVFLARFAEVHLEPCSEPPFSDVPVDHLFCREIAWIADAGIADGYEDGTFRPTAPVTRMAMAAFLYRYAH